MNELLIQRSVPVRDSVDVFIAGAGPSGAAAALVAARQGASVCLVDAMGCFGGTGTAAGLMLFCSPTDGVHLTSAGIGSEIYDRLIASGGVCHAAGGKKVGEFCFTYHPEALKRVYDDLMTAEKNIRFSFFTTFLGVRKEGGRVTHALCAAKSGVFAVEAKVFVDGTGDGDLCARAGAPFEKGDENGRTQPPTLISQWSAIDWDKANREGFGEWRQDREELLRTAFEDGVFSTLDLHLPGMLQIGPTTGAGNIGHEFGTDATDERSLTKAMIDGRRRAQEYLRYYREYLKGFESMELMATGAMLGVRESRRILGDYVLQVGDFERRAVFDDEIGRFSYPVDLHATTPDADAHKKFLGMFKTLRYKPGENYGIPYRSLCPRTLENVLVAGRCISADRGMQGSVRVMPGCYITGQAAGMAAALAAGGSGNVRDIDIRGLQGRLVGMGAYLPNYQTK